MRWAVGVLVAMLCLVATVPAPSALEVPVGGRALSLAARGAVRAFRFQSAALAGGQGPLPDPATGAALILHGSNAVGQCHAEARLPAMRWVAIGGDGAGKGWRYRDTSGVAAGVTAVTIARRPKGVQVRVRAKGAGFPCGVETAQAMPLTVVLRLGTTRYCAAFDAGSVRTNRRGRLRAGPSAPPAACPDADLTVADLNVLHGLFCPAPTAGCRRADRVALLRDWIVARGCPDVVALQEILDLGPSLTVLPLLDAALAGACPAPYARAYFRVGGVDDEIILSRHPILASASIDLYGPLRHVTHARIDHPIGAIDVYATHLASGSDGATSPCGTFGACPVECTDAGATTVRECQAVELGLAVAGTHVGAAPAIVTGDFNDGPGSWLYGRYLALGWTDAYLAAGNPECVPATGIGCTSGRIDDDLTDLEDPARHVDARIDHTWVVPPGPGSACAATLDGPDDDDGDGIGTRLFAAAPNPFAPGCGPAPLPVCWASDHSGVEIDLGCSPP